MLIIGAGKGLAQGTLTDSLVLRNATNGRLSQRANTATTPAGSWSLTWPAATSATGSILYGTLSGSNVQLGWLPPGSDGQVLTLSGGLPSWSASAGWLTTGNTIAASWDGVSGSFLGTINAEDLVLNTNNVFRARLVGGATNTGNLVLGTTAASPTNSTATQATDRLTVLGGDISLNSENNSSIVRALLFRGTSGGTSGRFRVAADGGDIYWQGGGGQRLQMGSYWGIEISGARGVSAFPAFNAGAGTDPHVNMLLTQTGAPGLVITPAAGFTANQTEWRNNAGTALSVVNNAGNVGLGVITGITSKLQVNASTTSGNGIQLDPYAATAGSTSELRFLELQANGSNFIAFKSANSMPDNHTYVLPASIGTTGQVLAISSISGTTADLSWQTAGTSIFEEVTSGSGNIRRRLPYTSGTVGTPGLYAIDLMGVRTAATLTASGDYSAILGGTSNRADGNYGIVVGGANNRAATLHASVLGGSFNISNGQYSTIGGGSSNNITGNYSAIAGGSGNTVSSNYSLSAGQNNTVSGNNSFVFGYGANVTQANSVVFNHPTAGTDATRVGINTNTPSTSLDVTGGVVIRPPATINVPANNFTVTVGNNSYVVLNPGGANRTGLILSDGLQTGQILILRIIETTAFYISMPDAAANNVNLTGAWVGRADDTITLIWTGVDWVELSRSNN